MDLAFSYQMLPTAGGDAMELRSSHGSTRTNACRVGPATGTLFS